MEENIVRNVVLKANSYIYALSVIRPLVGVVKEIKINIIVAFVAIPYMQIVSLH